MTPFEKKVKLTLGPISVFRDNDKITGSEDGLVKITRSMGYNADLNTPEKWGAYVQRFLPFAALVATGEELDPHYPNRYHKYWATFRERPAVSNYMGGVIDVNEQRALLQAQALVFKAAMLVRECGTPSTIDHLGESLGVLAGNIQECIDDRLLDKPGSLLEGENMYLAYLNAVDIFLFTDPDEPQTGQQYVNPVERALRQIRDSDFQKEG